jgi:hypothetical protein
MTLAIESTCCDRFLISGAIWSRVSSVSCPASSLTAVKMRYFHALQFASRCGDVLFAFADANRNVGGSPVGSSRQAV